MTTSFTANDLVRELPSGSSIQYGPQNDRIYLMFLGSEAPENLSYELIEMAKLSRYSKVFAKAPEQQAKPFVTNEYVEEVRVPGFYAGQNDALFFGYYFDPARAVEHNTETLDFATLPEWLGNRFARHLLARMEQEMKAKGIKTTYTIARAASPGINSTFGRAGYHFSGRLKNNTNISGSIESMNVWHKSLAH